MVRDKDYNESFTALVKRHEKIIFSVCFFYASKEIPFEDLHQEVLISVFNSYRGFKGQSSESAWIYRVCLNTCLFSLRKYTPKITTISLDDLPQIYFKDDTNNELRDKLEMLYASISTLNPMDKALILMWLDELSYEEIANNLGIPRNTVASRLSRIKDKLSSNIEK